ncbi:hypothetical protein SCHPADRAFT_817906 [Schizopora paradoxa]|uniref:DUF6593 domain-containing protein n=1 Tax=Schizopora paradoxa TaxID=27342 RepID=A0A0H2SRF3_9AGAM|nr:hypothetical protein SCHPADRAFT_817906 [Schizopora paradoxa]
MSSSASLYSFGGGLESQVTLVDTSAYGTPHAVVSFIRDDMKNTKILSETDEVLYSVSTDILTNAYTTVHRGDVTSGTQGGSEPIKVAEIKRKDLREDRIKFEGSSSSVKLSKWLHGSNGRCPVSLDWQDRSYTWKSNSARQIALYDSADERTPIAWFQTSRKQTLEGTPTLFRALLALQQEGQEILDAVVVSLLIVEYKLRWKEMKFRNADGRNTFQHYF